MRKWVFLLVSFLTFSCSSTPRPTLAVCAIFYNEAPWLKEWITYHHKVMGIDRFYLYNNNSTDHFLSVLTPFIEQGIVELIDWNSADLSHHAQGKGMDAPWSGPQLGAYNDCLKNRALGKFDWVAMIDIDEFIVPARGVEKFYTLLQRAKKQNLGTLRILWRVFGTSDVEKLGDEERLIEKLTWRARDDHALNQHYKSIHQPEAIGFCLVHKSDTLKPGYKAKKIPMKQVSIHHYWMRTAEECFRKRHMSKSTHPEVFETFHQVKDETILQYLPLGD